MIESYRIAQNAIADLKSAILMLLDEYGEQGLRNVDIGRALGIYSGHVRHEGHIPRTLLEMMVHEGVVRQDKSSQLWFLVRPQPGSGRSAADD
jgi:hypothetical protein